MTPEEAMHPRNCPNCGCPIPTRPSPFRNTPADRSWATTTPAPLDLVEVEHDNGTNPATLTGHVIGWIVVAVTTLTALYLVGLALYTLTRWAL